MKLQRKCHDCGRPTNDYRCAKCWRKLRGKQQDPGLEEVSMVLPRRRREEE